MRAAALSSPLTLRREADVTEIAVRRLTLTNFRCYESLRLNLDSRPVVLTGPNGAGKTNLLEAVSFLVPGRGLRRIRLGDAGRRRHDEAGTAPWAVSAAMDGLAGPVEIGTGLTGEEQSGAGRRAVRIDGGGNHSQAALADHVAAVWLTPDMDRIFTDSASARRRFLDRLVYGFDPGHASRISAYERAMRDRARLLRDERAGNGPADSAWLGALEDRMAERGIAIAAARRQVVARLATTCADGMGPFPAAGLALAGDAEAWLDTMPALEAEDRFRDSLAQSRRRDGESGRTLFGTHLSDLAVTYLNRGTPAAICSTGEQKALLISIVLANARVLGLERARVPLLLLDELAAHLDSRRRHGLFEMILELGAQAWMTGTDAETFAPLEDRAQFFHVESAVVTACYQPCDITVP